MNAILKVFTLFLCMTTFSSCATAQKAAKKVETATYKVAGVCDMCKKRIENAALIKGVKLAEWDKESQLLRIVYKTSKTSETAILQSVADAGYDSEKIAASDAAYNKLPACCAYRDGIEVH